MLVELLADLSGLGRGATPALAARGEPVLYVRVRSGSRTLGVVGVQAPDGHWAYLWDGDNVVPVEARWLAARRIAAVER